MRGCSILLEHVGRLARLFDDPGDLWQHLGLQDFQKVLAIDMVGLALKDFLAFAEVNFGVFLGP